MTIDTTISIVYQYEYLKQISIDNIVSQSEPCIARRSPVQILWH